MFNFLKVHHKESTETTPDLIFVSNVAKIATSGTSESTISDHKPLYVILDVKRNITQPVLKVIRDFKNANMKTSKVQWKWHRGGYAIYSKMLMIHYISLRSYIKMS